MKRFEQKYDQITGYLMSSFSGRAKNQNTVFSPLSFISLAAVAADATAGSTRNEIEQILRDTGMTSEELMACLKQMIGKSAHKQTLKMANCVYVRPELKSSIRDGYTDRLRERFDGTLFMTDRLEEAADTWVNEKTNGLIKKLGIKPAVKSLFGMGSAMAFNDRWAREYTEDEIEHDTFTNSDGTQSEVRMLESEEEYYVEDKYWEGFVKPYKQGEFSFMALLPKNEDLLIEASALAEICFSSLYHRKSAEPVKVMLPEFKIAYEADLSPEMEDLGVKTFFSENADFTPFSPAWLKGEKLMHSAFIEVDRNGTKAAAVSFIYGAAGSADFDKKYVWLTRPFVFAIVDQDTGLPVITGMVNHLDSNTDGDEITWDDKAQACYEYMCRIFEKLNPEYENDGVFEPGTVEYDLFRKARQACMHYEVSEMEKVEKEIDEYLLSRE